MSWYEFVFSEKPGKRVLRHILFWVIWWLYFSLCDYLFQKPYLSFPLGPEYVTVGAHLFLKTFLLISVYAIACYVFIYFILTKAIDSSWWDVILQLLLLGVFLFIAAYFMYWTFFPLLDSLFAPHIPASFPTLFWPAVYLGLINPTKVMAFAGIIKYVKYWWLKNQESEKINSEKIIAELQLLKAQIRPGFLFNALNNIYVYSLAASPRAPEMLLKLSDLLSYILYECDQSLVPLKKEMDIMKDYMALEKTRLDESFEMEINIIGNMDDKMIAPFLLLPFIENCFKLSNSLSEQPWINLDIVIDGNLFYMKLANGVMPDFIGLPSVDETWLSNVQKRLTLLYPRKHELKISKEQEMVILLLKLQLDIRADMEPGMMNPTFVSEPITTPPNRYAAQ